jgi:hypothetical protein
MPHRCVNRQAAVYDDPFNRTLQLLRAESSSKASSYPEPKALSPKNTVHHADVDIDAVFNVHFETAKHDCNEPVQKVSL